METTSKACTKCLRDLPLEQYGKQKGCPDGLRYECKDCQKRYMAEWRTNNREYLREASRRRRDGMSEEEKAKKRTDDLKRYYAAPEVARAGILRRKYGIGHDEYAAMLAAQNGVCAICGNDNGPHKVLAVDHHHDTGAVRGLLCDNCNNGLGRFRDNPEFLTRAIAYLLNT